MPSLAPHGDGICTSRMPSQFHRRNYFAPASVNFSASKRTHAINRLKRIFSDSFSLGMDVSEEEKIFLLKYCFQFVAERFRNAVNYC